MRPLARAVSAAGLAVSIASGLGCTRKDCNCSSAPAFTIQAPAGAISQVKLSGPACTGMFPACAMSEDPTYPPGCATTMVFARSAGECDVEVDFLDGRVFTRTLTLVAEAGDCCTLIRTDTPANAEIDLPGDARTE